MKSFTVILVLFCLSCGADNDGPVKTTEKVTKESAAKQGSADSAVDHCATEGWYGDGECDLFCLEKDVQDCGVDNLAENFCEESCSKRDDPSGWCSDEECVQYCKDNQATWDTPTEKAFQACATEDPLCFITIDQCVDSRKAADTVCEESCSKRDDPSGWCSDEECVQYCKDNQATWDVPTEQAFQACATEDPLCFITIDQCVDSRKIESFCEESCSKRDDPSGWCSDEECIQYCRDNKSSWDVPTEKAFHVCATEDPLCFITIEQCIDSRKE